MGVYAVTGSASGIGAAVRRLLESDGHTVVGVDLDGAEVQADLARPEGRLAAVEGVVAACGGRLDGLVTAAGLGPPRPAETILRVNHAGSVAVLEGLRPALAAAGGARVVQIGSNATTTTPGIPDEVVTALLDGDEDAAIAAVGTHPAEFASAIAYAASKTAVTRWCLRAAVTGPWVGSGIRLNVLAPGAVRTPLLQAGMDDPLYGPLIRAFEIPVGEPATPDEMAGWIAFLLSPAAAHACGSMFVVDGGSTAVLRADDWPRSFSL